jgi:hypothetical protein
MPLGHLATQRRRKPILDLIHNKQVASKQLALKLKLQTERWSNNNRAFMLIRSNIRDAPSLQESGKEDR